MNKKITVVSATFMIITLNTLDLMEYWNLYFWVCLVVTFIATAIIARIYLLSKMPNTYFNENLNIEDEGLENKKNNIFKEA